MLTEAERNEIFKVWGYTTVARQLVRLGVSQRAFDMLRQEYKKLHLVGPTWDEGNSVWTIKQVYAGRVETSTTHSGSLSPFLDAARTARRFEKFRLA